MLDLLIKNGLAYVDGDFRKCDIAVKDGKIAAVAECGLFGDGDAMRSIEAEGKYVTPGGIDTHIHIRDPGHADRETFYTGPLSAAQGGCTTILEHPISTPPQYNKEILDNRKRIAADNCVVDYAFYGAAGGQYPEEIVPLSKEGIVAYKSFLHQAPAGREGEFVGLTLANDAEIMTGMREIAKTGLMMASHAENNDMIVHNIEEFRAKGWTKPIDHCKSRPAITEYSTVSKLILMAKATGCKLELAHMSTPESCELAKQAKSEGQSVFVETCPHYLLLDESYLEKFGSFARCNPPLRAKEAVERMLFPYKFFDIRIKIKIDGNEICIHDQEIFKKCKEYITSTDGYKKRIERLSLVNQKIRIQEQNNGRLNAVVLDSSERSRKKKHLLK